MLRAQIEPAAAPRPTARAAPAPSRTLASQIGNRAFARLAARQRAQEAEAAPLGGGAAAPPTEVHVDLVKLAGSPSNPAADLALANRAWGACSRPIRFRGTIHTATQAQTDEWLGSDHQLECGPRLEPGQIGIGGLIGIEEQRMNSGATAAFGLTGPIKAYFVPGCTCEPRGYSHPPFNPAGGLEGVCVMCGEATTSTFAHELGHMLNINRHSSVPGEVMCTGDTRTGVAVTAGDCATANAAAASPRAGQPQAP
jgi:hypothetical protein